MSGEHSGLEGRDRAALALALTLVIAAVLRLVGLGDHTLTHPEAYVPGIPWPSYVFNPPRAETVAEVVAAALRQDVHPPGYYLVMLGWNRLFGIDIVSLRLPAALFGLASVAVLFALARRVRPSRVAWIAAAALALHGHHVFWSQHARMWTALALIGLLSSWSLLAALERPRRSMLLVFGLLSAAGLWTEYYYLPFFLVQLGWLVLRSARSLEPPPLLDAGILAMVLAAPIAVMLRFHAQRPGHIPAGSTSHVLAYLGFGRALNIEPGAASAGESAALVVLACAGAVLAGFGLREVMRRSDPDAAAPGAGQPPGGTGALAPARLPVLWLVAAALLSSLTTRALFLEPIGARRFLWLVVGLPWALVAARALLPVTWRLGSPALRSIASARALRWIPADLVATLALLPFFGLLLAHLVKPVLAQRGLLVALPFLLVLQVDGALALLRARGRGSAGRVAAAAAALALAFVSWYGYASAPNSPRDYREMGRKLVESVGPGEAILVRDIWYATPIHYYLMPLRDRVMSPKRFARRVSAAPESGRAGAWVVGFGEDVWVEQQLREVEAVLPGFVRVRRISAYNAAAILLAPAGSPSASAR